MTEALKGPAPNIHSRMGAVEARMSSVEARLDKHDVQIAELQRGDAAMLAKLSENDSRWVQIQEQLRVVEQIQDIRNTMSTIGKLVKAAAMVIKYCLLVAALTSAVYLAVKTGDLTSLQNIISTILGM